MAFQAGDFVGVVCEVKPGPFSDERLVTLETVEGAIAGFVSESELREGKEGWEVRGKIKEIIGDKLKIEIYGSFFTTNGTAVIQRNLAMAA